MTGRGNRSEYTVNEADTIVLRNGVPRFVVKGSGEFLIDIWASGVFDETIFKGTMVELHPLIFTKDDEWTKAFLNERVTREFTDKIFGMSVGVRSRVMTDLENEYLRFMRSIHQGDYPSHDTRIRVS